MIMAQAFTVTAFLLFNIANTEAKSVLWVYELLHTNF